MMERIKSNKKLIVIAFLLLCVSFGVTLALSKSQSNTLTNSFTPGSVETIIEEDEPKPSGSDIAKAPRVKNTGKNDALIRMKVTMSPSELVEKLNIKLTMNNGWTYKSDGYYYYNEILKPGQYTAALFTKVTGKDIIVNGKFSEELDGLEIAVYHESVQNLIKEDNGAIVQAKSGTDKDATRIWSVFDSLNQ